MGVTRATSRVSLALRGGPHGLPTLPMAAVLLVLAMLSLYSCIPLIQAVFSGYYAFDWENFRQAAARLDQGTLYNLSYPYIFRWSPLAAWILGFVTLMPLWLWQVLHVAVLPVLRVWWLAAVCLISAPLWFDIQTGNIMIFVAVTAFWALRGNRVATALFLVLTVLVPRPLMLPLAVWLLWNRPEWRAPFAVFFAAHTVLVSLSGYGLEWVSSLLSAGGEVASPFNLGPSALIGYFWVPIGAALAIWLTVRGRLGLASLAISPYWLPYYFLMLVLEFRSSRLDSGMSSSWSPGASREDMTPDTE